MTAHQPILPAKAIELVKSREFDEADTLLADFAAAGLIKTYALVREIRPTGGPSEMLRDAQIPPEDWQRIIASENIQIALSGGTVRLQGSSLAGGIPSVLITGISFSEAALVKVLDRYCVDSPVGIRKQAIGCDVQATTRCATSSAQPTQLQTEVVQPIRSGDLTASVAQTIQATGLSRTTIDKLMRDGTLARKKVGRRTLITVESIERLVDAKAGGKPQS